ncbi:hypothetical protein DVU_0427 [Nitratidesulfovibrio vulgaris str. Hildenborough]|uniref:Uncharacterized protein n=1 Tax=Nitratidesulfovibrio vulgaris (strain ATCC 29579 / DSM 644 / CCUG 34227 / NCIMB 8303 / VKM B-1760 / Hildenborough) TaxID=882 RepID=Q72EZ1_NITV2|nr:hypothetical protein DVU_0427 [Nitratidesulfovibrio vulgaris str. Hildenborough]
MPWACRRRVQARAREKHEPTKMIQFAFLSGTLSWALPDAMGYQGTPSMLKARKGYPAYGARGGLL